MNCSIKGPLVHRDSASIHVKDDLISQHKSNSARSWNSSKFSAIFTQTRGFSSVPSVAKPVHFQSHIFNRANRRVPKDLACIPRASNVNHHIGTRKWLKSRQKRKKTTLHWISPHISLGRLPQQLGHTRLPQPPGSLHREKVLMSLTCEPSPSIFCNICLALSDFSGLASVSAIVCLASAYLQHATLQIGQLPWQVVHLRFTVFHCRLSSTLRGDLESVEETVFTSVPVRLRTWSIW